MKGTPLKFHAPKMMGRNSGFRFAAYKSDMNAAVEAEEKAFQESIKDLPEETKAVVIAARKSFTQKIQLIQAAMLNKEEAEPILTELTKQFKENESAMKEVNRLLALHGTTLQNLKSGNDVPVHQSVAKEICETIAEKHAEIVEAYKSGNVVKIFGGEEMVGKAVGLVTVASSSAPAGTPDLYGAQSTPPQPVSIREDDILHLTTNVNTNQASFPYTEAKPKDNDYAFQTAEGASKQQIDFVTETRFANPVTLAAWIQLSQQSVQDVPYMQSVAIDLLYKKHNRKKNNAILFGSGAAGQCKGATLYASVFSAGALANAVGNPNIMDIIGAIVTRIFTTHDYQDQLGYRANFVAMNPLDFYINFVAAKTSFGTPLYPTAALFNQITMGGVTIMPTEDISAGYIFVGDMSKYNTTNYIPYSVSIGRINDDFIKNQFVILGESRFHAYVRKLDEKALIYDTIDNVKSAITKASNV